MCVLKGKLLMILRSSQGYNFNDSEGGNFAKGSSNDTEVMLRQGILLLILRVVYSQRTLSNDAEDVITQGVLRVIFPKCRVSNNTESVLKQGNIYDNTVDAIFVRRYF
jgi:hypothetical protein